MTDHSGLVKHAAERLSAALETGLIPPPFDRHIRTILEAERDARGWRELHDAAQRVVAERNAALNTVSAEREALQARVAELEAGHRYIAKQWPDSFAARHARALLERKPS